MQPKLNSAPDPEIEASFRDLSRIDLCLRQISYLPEKERDKHKPTEQEIALYDAAVAQLHAKIAAEPALAARLAAYATQFESEGAVRALRGNPEVLKDAVLCIQKHIDGTEQCSSPTLPLLLAGSGNPDYERLLIDAANNKSAFASTPGGKRLREYALCALGEITNPDAQQTLLKTMLTIGEDQSLRETAKRVLQQTATDEMRDQCLKLTSWEVAAATNDTSQTRKWYDWVRLNSISGNELRSVLQAAKEVGEYKPGSRGNS